MILFVGGACDTGKGKIVFDLYSEGTEKGKKVDMCLDPVERNCQEFFGKPFDQFISRRVFFHQEELLKQILFKSLQDSVQGAEKADYFLVNETPLTILALASWFGIGVSLNETERDDLFSKALEYSCREDVYHIVVQPWQETYQRKWNNYFIKQYSAGLDNVFVIPQQVNYNKTIAAAKEKAIEILGW